MKLRLLTAAIVLALSLTACVNEANNVVPKPAMGRAEVINAEVPPGSTNIKQDADGWVTFQNGTKCYTYHRSLGEDGYSYLGSVYEVDCPALTPGT